MVLFGSSDHPTQFQINFAMIEVAVAILLTLSQLPNA